MNDFAALFFVIAGITICVALLSYMMRDKTEKATAGGNMGADDAIKKIALMQEELRRLANELSRLSPATEPMQMTAASATGSQDATFDAWVRRCLQPSTDDIDPPSADRLHRHLCAFSDQIGGRAYSKEAFKEGMRGILSKFSAVRMAGKDGSTIYKGIEINPDGDSGEILKRMG